MVKDLFVLLEKKNIPKYLYLEKGSYKIRENEKRNYSTTKTFIHIKPFLINKESLKIRDTEFNRIIGSCDRVISHNKAIDFMYKLKNIYQKKN